MDKIKTRKKISKEEINKFNPTHIKFNFSFISYCEDFTDEHKCKLLDRIMELSKEPYLIIANRDKKIGFEIVNLDIKKEIKKEFYQGNRTFNGKYTVIRLYPNNNPKPSRIIGTLINQIFYIFFIDIDGKLYKH